MSVVYDIEDRIFINEQGNKLNYKRLVITGYLNGNLETIELPIKKEQAIIYNAMRGSEAPTVQSHKATYEEQQSFVDKNGRIKDDDDSELFE